MNKSSINAKQFADTLIIPVHKPIKKDTVSMGAPEIEDFEKGLDNSPE